MELVVDTGPGYRVYCAFVGRRNLLLLAGGSKGSQRRDIALAKRRWHDFKARNSATEFGS